MTYKPRRRPPSAREARRAKATLSLAQSSRSSRAAGGPGSGSTPGLPSTIKVTDPGDLIAYVPYSLGFWPTESVVAVGLAGSQVQVTARVDLPPADMAADVAQSLVDGIAHAIDAVVLIIWSATPPDPRVLDELEYAFVRADVAIGHVMCTDGRTYRDVCDGLDAPEDMVPGAEDVDACMHAIVIGQVAAPSRAEATALLDPEPGACADAVERALAVEARLGIRETIDAVDKVLVQGCLDPAAIAQLAECMTSILLRDMVLAWLAPEIDGPADECGAEGRALARHCGSSWRVAPGQITSDELTARLAQTIKWCPPSRRAPVLTLLGAHLWSQTAGALATEAVARALELQPDYQLARLILQALSHGVRPMGREEPDSA